MRSRVRRQHGFAYIRILSVVGVLGLLWWQRAALLAPIGSLLNVGEAPRRVDAVVVLAGGWEGGGRILKAGELVRAGFAPYALMSGPNSYYEQPECNYAIPFATQRGFPLEYFQCAPNRSLNTEDEAEALIAELQRRKVRTFLVVSVETHLRRARTIYTRLLPPGMEVHFIASDSPGFQLSQWWKVREGRKAIFFEWTKLITTQFGI
jgi:uncharacterized SAM-binding protein YcdF (DUF218 family)